MSWSINNVRDLLGIAPAVRARTKPVEDSANGLNDLNILFFVMAADIIGFSWLSPFEDNLQCSNVIFNVKPVTYLIARTVNRQ